MSDIVERLRAGHINSVCAEEAAVEIERLRSDRYYSELTEKIEALEAEITRLHFLVLDAVECLELHEHPVDADAIRSQLRVLSQNPPIPSPEAKKLNDVK